MSGFVNVLAAVEPRPEDGMNIVQGRCDESWTPFWLQLNTMTMSQKDMFRAVGDTLKRAMAHFKVEKLEDLEMLEVAGIRIVQPHRPDGTRFDDYVIHVRKKASVS